MNRQERDLAVARIEDFINEACEREGLAMTRPSILYTAYVAWAEHHGVVPVTKPQLGHLLYAMGFQRAAAPGGGVRLGLRLREGAS